MLQKVQEELKRMENNQSGVKPDPDKVEANCQLPLPEDVQELKRVLGMVNYLGRFVPALATARTVVDLNHCTSS